MRTSDRRSAHIDGVIAFEDLLELVRTGGSSSNTSIAAFLLPFIERGELRVVSETTPEGLDACRRLLPGFADAFRIVQIPSFTQPEALATLQAYCAAIERNNPARIDNDGRRLIYRLFQRFLPYEAFPEKTAMFTSRLYEHAKTTKLSEITNNVIINCVCEFRRLPELFLRDEVPLQEDDVLGFFQSEVIGQEEACQAATGTVLTFKAGLNDPARPLMCCSSLVQPVLARLNWRDRWRVFFLERWKTQRFVRLDMSEYSSPGSAERLVSGSSGETSEFINRMRRQPFAVVLLDKVEKTHEGVFDVLLSVFDEGGSPIALDIRLIFQRRHCHDFKPGCNEFRSSWFQFTARTRCFDLRPCVEPFFVPSFTTGSIASLVFVRLVATARGASSSKSSNRQCSRRA